MEMTFRQLNPHSCRTYLIGIQESNDVIIVDPVLDHLNDYLELFEKENLKLTHCIDTHTHADHISCCSALKDITDCEYIMHERAPAQCVTIRVTDGKTLELLGMKIEVIHTPGHTKDSTCLIFPDRILTGDTLFLDDGGAGRDDLPGGDPNEHWESLQKILKLPGHLVVYPAHEYRDREPSTLARQKQTNPHLKPRTKEDFVRHLEDLRLGPADWMKDVLKANYACARDPKAAWVPVDMPACEVKGTLDHGVNEIEVQPVSVEELKIEMESDDPPILLDVREKKELVSELGHLPGIQHIPIGSLTARLAELETNKDKKIVTVCRSGARAYTAAQILKQVGFSKVSVLDGGMLRWKELKLPVQRDWT
jgi:glyoxylase-like metal-dependent hydrolase (beta-lactamase superfamily II)/rhodanese-related sulfurtransferase